MDDQLYIVRVSAGCGNSESSILPALLGMDRVIDSLIDLLEALLVVSYSTPTCGLLPLSGCSCPLLGQLSSSTSAHAFLCSGCAARLWPSSLADCFLLLATVIN